VDASLALADLLHRTDSAAAAIGLLVDVLTADPYALEALVLLGRILIADGRPAEGLAAMERVLRFDSGHAEALFHTGDALARLRRYRQAVACWDRVAHLDPAGTFAASARSRSRSARDLEHILAPVA
jgi:cytochrome c-type biogenesis protein CcmH/NrfG